jgi:hypothetical protein
MRRWCGQHLEHRWNPPGGGTISVGMKWPIAQVRTLAEDPNPFRDPGPDGDPVPEDDPARQAPIEEPPKKQPQQGL